MLIDIHLLKSELLYNTGINYPLPGGHLVDRGFPKFLSPGEKDPLTGRLLNKGRIYINKEAAPDLDRKAGGQYFDGILPEVWSFHIGGYQVLDKWLKERRDRKLANDDIDHYKKVVKAIVETIRIIKEIDDVIPGFPLP
jgi:hypothetical protein